jgi:lysophospholipase L1-like esterase
MKKKSWKSPIVLSLLTIVIMDIFLCQVYGLVSVTSKDYRIPSRVYHHGFANNVDIVETWDHGSYRLVTNSLGFKDRFHRKVLMKTKKRRLLFMGDSFTEGVGVPFEKTFVGIIEKVFQEQNIEVLNAGVVSYSPKIFLQKINYLISEGLEFDELICLMDLTDIEDEMLYAMEQVSREKMVSKRTSMLTKFKMQLTQYSLIFKVLHNVRKWAYNKPRIDERRSKWPIDNSLYQELQPGILLAQKHMNQLHALLVLHKIKLKLVVYPHPDQIFYEDWNSKYVDLWQSWAQDRDLEVIDLFPLFQGRGEFEDVYSAFFIRNDVHWNANGHALIAPYIMQHIVDN